MIQDLAARYDAARRRRPRRQGGEHGGAIAARGRRLSFGAVL